MNDQALVGGILAIAAGAPMLLYPKRARQKTEEAWKTRLTELHNGADERYLEERRSLEAYPPIRSDKRKRAFGALLVAGGVASIILAFIK